MTNDDAVSLREYIQDRLKDMDKAVLANSADVQRSLKDLKDGLNEVRALYEATSNKYVTIDMFQTNIQQRFEGVDRLAKQLIETVDFRFSVIEKSTTLASASLEHRLEGMNEFRQTISDTQKAYMPRSEYEAKHAELISRIDNLANALANAKDEHHTYLTREELEAFRKELLSRFESADVARENIVTRVASLEKVYANMQGRVSAIAVGITILSIAVATVLHFIPV